MRSLFTLLAGFVFTLPLAAAAETPLRGDPAIGQQLFRMECGSCHGMDGSGSAFWERAIAGTKWSKPPNLRDGTFLALRTDEDLHQVMAGGHGKDGWIAGHSFTNLSPLDRWNIIQWLRDQVMSVAEFFPQAVQFTAKDFEIDDYGVERLGAVKVVLDETERSVTILTVYKGRKLDSATDQDVSLVPWEPVTLDLLQPGDRLGFLAFVDIEVPRSNEVIQAGLSFDTEGKLQRVQVQHPDPSRKASYERILSAFVGQGSRTATAYRAPAGVRDGAAWAAALTRAAGRVAEGIIMFDKAERARTAFDR